MKRKVILPYSPKLKEVARRLRKSGTLSEVLLWRYLKGKQVLGYDFDRQKPIDNYIVDFFCNELMLAIEIDGVSHENKGEEDRIRQSRLESLGVRFLRFYDSDVKGNIQGVVTTIEEWIKTNESTPDPSKEESLKKHFSKEKDEEPKQSNSPIPSLLKDGNRHIREMRGQKSFFPEKETYEKIALYPQLNRRIKA
ncbi:MAG: endonuclease domain-containing protein [wastewater metagenome]|nr:endonuclease domain-containing protein [Candidatus Loosdrechtia aerotolerans]